jgi:ElaB/YqjD/DUF883 family membrane-anchored ribosome-binding protein
MKTDSGNNATSSGTTSASAKATDSAGAKPSSSLSEAEFLKQEAARARIAIGDALTDLGESLKATADPHVLTRDHPWIAISTAAVAGFAAAVAMIPSKEQQALRDLAELERARHAPPPSTSDKAVVEGAVSGSVVGTIASEVLKTVRPLITTLITAAINHATSGFKSANSSDAPHSETETNGHAGSAEEISSPS